MFRTAILAACLALLLAGLTAACTTPLDADPSGPPTDSPSGPDRTPGTVSGTVLDTQGRPLAGARVWIQPSITTGVVETRTDAGGRYAVSGLPNIPYYAYAWTEVNYEGERFCLRLAMPGARDYDSFTPAEGVVRDFRWQLTGPIEDLRQHDGYFGGEVRLFTEGRFDGRVELVFAPTGPLVDGSAPAPFTRELDVNAGVMVYDVPLGRYEVWAVLVGADGRRTSLRVGTDYADRFEAQTEAASLGFRPSGSCSQGSGVARGFLYVNSPYAY